MAHVRGLERGVAALISFSKKKKMAHVRGQVHLERGVAALNETKNCLAKGDLLGAQRACTLARSTPYPRVTPALPSSASVYVATHCIHTHTHTHTHTCIYTHARARAHTHTHTIYIYI